MGLSQYTKRSMSLLSVALSRATEAKTDNDLTYLLKKKGTLADSQHKARFLTFVWNDKRCCHFDRREKSLAPGFIEFPRIIE